MDLGTAGEQGVNPVLLFVTDTAVFGLQFGKQNAAILVREDKVGKP
jgi:hypothetical protein